MLSGLIPFSISFKTSARRIVVLPAPGTAEIAIAPFLYSKTGFWSSLGIILNRFCETASFFSTIRNFSIPPKFSTPWESNNDEKA